MKAGDARMPRLRYNDEWFHQLSIDALPEAHFEDLLIQNSEMIRTDAWMTRFKRKVYARGAAARGDLAIIDHDYREWFVVEVEMRRHPLYEHVLPQVRTLRDGYYGPEEADYLVRSLPLLDPNRTNDLVRGVSPKIVVIGDRADEWWRDVLSGADIQFITMEIYKSDFNRYIFSLDGGLPQRSNDLISYCTYNSMLPRQLQIETPPALGISHGESMLITCDGQSIEWSRIDTKDNCYLRTRGPVKLRAGARYALLRSDDGATVLKVVGARG
jgi:hypothetical protein